MGWTSIAMSMEPETSPVPAALCETEANGKVSLEGSTWRTVVDAEPCYCPYCRSVVGTARPRNISPMAAIDLFSLPDDGDVLRG